MTGLKAFRLVPFCLLLLAANVCAVSNGASGADIASYARIIQQSIQSRSETFFNKYKGKQCVVRIHLARDGSLSEFDIEGGAPDLCSEISDVMRSIKKFPAPPNDSVYQKIKDAKLGFNF